MTALSPVSHDGVVIDNEDPESFFRLVAKVTCFLLPAPKTRVSAGSPSPWRPTMH